MPCAQVHTHARAHTHITGQLSSGGDVSSLPKVKLPSLSDVKRPFSWSDGPVPPFTVTHTPVYPISISSPDAAALPSIVSDLVTPVLSDGGLTLAFSDDPIHTTPLSTLPEPPGLSTHFTYPVRTWLQHSGFCSALCPLPTSRAEAHRGAYFYLKHSSHPTRSLAQAPVTTLLLTTASVPEVCPNKGTPHFVPYNAPISQVGHWDSQGGMNATGTTASEGQLGMLIWPAKLLC